MTQEEIRSAIATAIVQAGYEEGAEDGPSLFEWHHCFDTPACRGDSGPCACSGVPYISDAVWDRLGPVIDKIRACAV